MKTAYAVFLSVSLILGGRFLYQFAEAARDQWNNRHRIPGSTNEVTVQEIHFPPVELNPVVQARIDELLLHNDIEEPADAAGRSVGSDKSDPSIDSAGD